MTLCYPAWKDDGNYYNYSIELIVEYLDWPARVSRRATQRRIIGIVSYTTH